MNTNNTEIMIYPVLAYKEKGDVRLYGFREENKLKHTSRELLRAGIFNDVFIIDSAGNQYELKNVREVGWANPFWGISLMRKGRQIIVDFDLDIISKKSLDDIKDFVLTRLRQSNKDVSNNEIYKSVKNSNSLEQIIKIFV